MMYIREKSYVRVAEGCIREIDAAVDVEMAHTFVAQPLAEPRRPAFGRLDSAMNC